MISTTLNPIRMTRPRVDAEWLTATAEKVLEAVEERRSTWQSWHVRAEAQRQVRAVQVPTNKIDQLVELLVTEVLHTQSISLTRRDDGISEPVALRRIDGSSVYTVAGSGCSPPPGFWPPTSDSSRPLAAPTGVLRMPPVWIWLCWNQPRTGTPWTWDRPLWFVLCAAPGRGCNWPSRPLAPGRPPRCASWLGRGPIAAATWSGWPRRPPRRAPRRHRCAGRNAGQAHLVHPLR